MKSIHETDQLVLGQEQDQLRALGTLSMLAMLGEIYARTQLFEFVDTMRGAIAAEKYAILYERVDKDAVVKVPVAFVTWAHLGRTVETIFVNRFRPLTQPELSSGKTLWLMDLVAPFGHGKDVLAAFSATIGKDHPNFKRTQYKNGKLRVGALPNTAKEK